MSTLTNFRRTIQLGAWLAAGAMCAIPAPSRAQDQPAPPPQAASPAEPQPAVATKKEPKLVLAYPGATDKNGNYVHYFPQNNFKVFEKRKHNRVPPLSAAPLA